ncbi:hypothetical protein HYU92_05070 [Candidatus Curtissbacteria bacterium]|nr:hypothetical protein [Candidatus Curtissbacteria bacterium]
MVFKKGFTAHLILVVVFVIAAWGVAIYLLVTKGLVKLPSFLNIKKEPTVELKTQYQNPFHKQSQYVNPFDKYKNPFAGI